MVSEDGSKHAIITFENMYSTDVKHLADLYHNEKFLKSVNCGDSIETTLFFVSRWLCGYNIDFLAWAKSPVKEN